MKVSESGLPENIKEALMWDHGKDATIEEVIAKPDSELCRSANVGRRTINIVREYAATI